MNVLEARNQGYPQFTGEQRRDYIKRINFLYELADGYDRSVDPVSLTLFCRPNGVGLIPFERDEMRAAFNSWKRRVAPRKHNIKPICESVVKSVEASINYSRSYYQGSLEQRVQSRTQEIERLRQEMRSVESEIVTTRMAMNNFDPKAIDLPGQMKALTNEGWFSFLRALSREANNVPRDSIRFKTPPIHLSETNPAAGLDLQVNLGSYIVIFYPDKFELEVAVHKDNITFPDSSAIHPFIKTGGPAYVCWGDQAEIARELRVKWDFVGYMNLLRALLTTYPGGSPWQSLQSFQTRQRMNLDEMVRLDQVNAGGLPERAQATDDELYGAPPTTLQDATATTPAPMTARDAERFWSLAPGSINEVPPRRFAMPPTQWNILNAPSTPNPNVLTGMGDVELNTVVDPTRELDPTDNPFEPEPEDARF